MYRFTHDFDLAESILKPSTSAIILELSLLECRRKRNLPCDRQRTQVSGNEALDLWTLPTIDNNVADHS